MAIVSKTNRDGIDVVIESLQQKFYAQLLGLWEAGSTYQMYPRANKNYRQNQIIPEISLDEKDYSEVLTDDKFSVTSFFLNNDERVFQDEFKRIKQSISIVFQANLVELYGLTERADELFNMDILRVLKKENFYIYGDVEMIEGIDNVYSGLTLTGDLKENINLTDISQYHVLRVNFDVIYKPNCNITLSPVCAGVSVSVDGVFSEVVPSGGSYNCITGGGSGSIDIDINTQPFLTDQSTDVDINVHDSVGADVGGKVGSDWVIADALNFFNGSPISGVKAEGNKTITVFNSNADNVGAVVANSVDELEIEISNSTVSNSDDSYIASVLAEGSLELPDITVTDSDGSTSSFPAVKNVVCTPVNYLNVGGIYLGGTDTSYTSGDEANDPPGVGSTWYLLSSDNSWLNEFGNNLRFTGTTGGGYNGSAYVDIDGNPTTKALAYPNDVMLIWNRFNQKLNTVPAVCFNPLASATLTSHLASQPYTIDGKNNWKVMTLNELDEFSRKWTNSSGQLNYPPIDYSYAVTTDRLWTRTPAEIVDFYYFWTGVFLSRASKATLYKTMVTRLYTLTELGL